MTGVAVIGTGQWGRNHARLYKELWQEGMVDTVKVCDANETNLRNISTTLNLEGMADYRQTSPSIVFRAMSAE